MTELIPDFEEAGYPALVQSTQDDALAAAINRLAHAIEKNTVALQGQRVPAAVTITTPPSAPVLAPLPPVVGQAQPQVMVDGCPIHHTPWKVVPAGVSKKTGKPYDSFRACSVQGCDQRPRI